MLNGALNTASLLRCRLTAMLAVGAVLAGPVSAENWPQWRGPSGDSTSREQNLPLNWSETSGLVWKIELPEWGTSTPAIWGDTIFITTQVDDRLLLSKLNRADGKVVWERQVGTSDTRRAAEKRSGQKFHQLHNNASPSPVTDGQVVIAHYGNGDLVLNVCMQDSLEGVADKRAPSYLVAYDKRSGKQVWKTMRTTPAEAEQCDSYTTPILYNTHGRMEMLVMGGNQIDAYDPTTGKQLWFLSGITGGRTITGPAVGHDMVFVTQGQKGNLLAVKTGGQGQLSEKAVTWKHDSNTPDTCCPVLWGHLLFTVADNGIAMCLDAYTGHMHWKERVPGKYKASPVAADGRIYFLSMDGLCTVVSAGDRFEKLAENQIDDETTASPAISDGRIYLRARKHLYAVGKR